MRTFLRPRVTTRVSWVFIGQTETTHDSAQRLEVEPVVERGDGYRFVGVQVQECEIEVTCERPVAVVVDDLGDRVGAAGRQGGFAHAFLREHFERGARGVDVGDAERAVLDEEVGFQEHGAVGNDDVVRDEFKRARGAFVAVAAFHK